MTIVLAGTLDDPSFFDPKLEVYCEPAQPWGSCWPGAAKVPQDAYLIPTRSPSRMVHPRGQIQVPPCI